jgi:UDP-N-acetylmuramoyl-tripeptide--D-alanyl-D-alanine ligase
MCEVATKVISNRPVIAITGSAGKSTTKEMLAAILKTRFSIFKSPDNWNFINHTQKYKSQIYPWHKAVVLEYGMSGPGHIKRHCQIIKPNMAIITNVGTAHIGSFGGDVRKLAAAKSELILYMVQSGTLVVNADDENSKLLLTKNFHGKIITVGIHKQATYQAHHVLYSQGGMSFQVNLNGQPETFYIPIYGEHQVYNALAAIAIAHTLGFTANEMKHGLRHYQKMHSRLSIHHLQGHIKIIDDTFSSNPQAAKAAINVLSSIGKGTNVAILGNMLALGAYSSKGHADVGAHLAQRNVHYLLTYGELAKRIGTAAIANGFPEKRVYHFSNRASLNQMALSLLKPSTTILVKGSHDAFMSETVNFLLGKRGRVPGDRIGRIHKGLRKTPQAIRSRRVTSPDLGARAALEALGALGAKAAGVARGARAAKAARGARTGMAGRASGASRAVRAVQGRKAIKRR